MKGFTLIEVVVSIAIALLVTGFIIANYNTYNDTQTLKQAGLTLKNNLRFAQEKAISGLKPTSTAIPTPVAPICTQLAGYTVTFTTSGGISGYTIRALCNPEGALGEIISVTLPANITFTTPASGTSFRFNVLSRGTTLATPLTITLSGFGNLYRLSVSPGGDISEVAATPTP